MTYKKNERQQINISKWFLKIAIIITLLGAALSTFTIVLIEPLKFDFSAKGYIYALNIFDFPIRDENF
jgi:hypothetical protein